jgi:predicted enzyme related to lactoylglutathione lyase
VNEPGTFIWNELVTPDQQAAGPFYSQLFGWERHEVDAGPWGIYTTFRQDGQDVAGMMNPTASDYAGSPPPRWVAYIAVADADAIAGRVPELGGRVLEHPRDIPGVGRIGMFTDPTGALVCIMQPHAGAEGGSESAS